MSEIGASGTLPTITCFGDESYDALVSELPESCFSGKSYDALAASLPSCIFHRNTDDFEDGCEKRIGVTCELGTIIGHFIPSAKFLPPLLSGADAVVCVVLVFDPSDSLSGAVLCHHARDCYLLPFTGSTSGSLRRWLEELKKYLHCAALDGFRAKCFSVNVLQAEWRLQALACCDDALGDMLDVQYLAASFLGINLSTALEEACIMEHKHTSSCFFKTAQTGLLERHWVQGLLHCARCRSLKSLVSRALFAPDALSATSSFMNLRALVAASAQRGAKAGVLIDFNRLEILRRSASAHRPRTPLLRTIQSSCDVVERACKPHADKRFRWSINYNSLTGEICSDLQHFPEFSTNLCSRAAVALSSTLAMVHAPAPPFAAFTIGANSKQDVTVLSILDHGLRAVVRFEDGTEAELATSSIQVIQLVRDEYLSARSAMISNYGFCFISVTVPMCPWMFLGQAARDSVISAFAVHRSSDAGVMKFDRNQAATCATSAISNLLAAALPQLAPHQRCTCMRLALASQRYDTSTWASQLETDSQAAQILQSATLSALSEILTGPAHSQHLPFHAVKPSLLGRRAPSVDSFFDATLQHAWMSCADLMMLLACECEKCLQECLGSKLNANSAAATSAGEAAADVSPTKSVVHDCFSLVAVLSHTVVFSCRRIFLHAALDALRNCASRLGKLIHIEFPHRVAAGDNIGTSNHHAISFILPVKRLQVTSTVGTARCSTCCRRCSNSAPCKNASRTVWIAPIQNQSATLQQKQTLAQSNFMFVFYVHVCRLHHCKQRIMLSRPPITTARVILHGSCTRSPEGCTRASRDTAGTTAGLQKTPHFALKISLILTTVKDSNWSQSTAAA
jgi:hypothetical protein